MIIELNRVARITAGSHCGAFVRIVEDPEDPYAYCVFLANEADFCKGAFFWLETPTALNHFITQQQWRFAWTDLVVARAA